MFCRQSLASLYGPTCDASNRVKKTLRRNYPRYYVWIAENFVLLYILDEIFITLPWVLQAPREFISKHCLPPCAEPSLNPLELESEKQRMPPWLHLSPLRKKFVLVDVCSFLQIILPQLLSSMFQHLRKVRVMWRGLPNLCCAPTSFIFCCTVLEFGFYSHTVCVHSL